MEMLRAFGHPVQHMSQHHATMLQDVALKCCERLARPLCQYLPQLVQMESGLDDCGILNHMRRNTEIWKPVFASGIFFTITADKVSGQYDSELQRTQICKDVEIATSKFFSDVLTSIDAGGILIGSCKKINCGIRSCYSTKESSFNNIHVPMSLGLT